MTHGGTALNYEVLEALRQIAQEKNVNRDLVVETLEIGLISAAKKRFGLGDNVEVTFDSGSGSILVEAIKDIVEDDAVEDTGLQMGLSQAKEINPSAEVGTQIREALPFAAFGRNAIQTAKQVLVQRVREAEREKIHEDYQGRIGEIIRAIDEIAFQTNLLALNAAVEAARAGEAGKGFAVVAEEVRNLAQRSAEAARETTSMVEESNQRSENGARITRLVEEAFGGILNHAVRTSTLLEEMAAASSEQAEGVEQIHAAVGSLDEVVQQTAASSEELAAAAEETSGQVESLRSTVSTFRWTSDDGSAGSRSSTASARPVATPTSAPSVANGEDDWSDWSDSIDAIEAIDHSLPGPRKAA